MNWKTHIGNLDRYLSETQFTDGNSNQFTDADFFREILRITLVLRQKGNTLYFIGNGASASMSSHMAADFAKNGRIHTETFTDLALITAVANDISYEDVFAMPLKSRARAGDVLVAISSSGSSPNIIRAVEAARQIGMTVITLSGMKPENPLRKLGTWNVFVPAPTYGFVETAHAAVLHYWMDAIYTAGAQAA